MPNQVFHQSFIIAFCLTRYIEFISAGSADVHSVGFDPRIERGVSFSAISNWIVLLGLPKLQNKWQTLLKALTLARSAAVALSPLPFCLGLFESAFLLSMLLNSSHQYASDCLNYLLAEFRGFDVCFIQHEKVATSLVTLLSKWHALVNSLLEVYLRPFTATVSCFNISIYYYLALVILVLNLGSSIKVLRAPPPEFAIAHWENFKYRASLQSFEAQVGFGMMI